MKRFFKTIFVLVLILFTQKIIFAQDLEKTVEIVVSGSGKTQDIAKEIAIEYFKSKPKSVTYNNVYWR